MAFQESRASDDGGGRNQQPIVLDAAEVYLLMKEEYRISRNIRASWFLRNINKCITVKEEQHLLNSTEELEILSVMPKKQAPAQEPAPGQQVQYRLLPTCHVTFLARRYRLVIVLDLSPSMTTVDILSGNIHIAECHAALKKYLKGITKPFCVPGSPILLSPHLYVTVIAYTPLAQLTTQQVLVQGCLLTTQNVDVFLERIHSQLEDFENKIYNSMLRPNNPEPVALDGVDGWLTDGLDTIIGSGHTDSPGRGRGSTSHRPPPKVEMANPEATFVNMLWCGVLALQLLPENTSAGIVVITDGVAAVPDAPTLNTLLSQMRTSTTACSFIQLGKGFHPHSGFGYVPHTEIMQFIATATFGAFLSSCPSFESLEDGKMNQYHRAFLSWSFQKGLDGIKIDLIKGRQHKVISSDSGWAESIQPSFAFNDQGLCTIPLIRKKHNSTTLHTGLANVLSIRLREGYTIKDALLTNNGNDIEVRLALPWKYNARIEYIATAPWPLYTSRHVTHVEIIMEGSYEFLHDITCPMKNSRQNTYRTKVVRNFWQTLQSLRETDQLLVHLQSFAANPIYYTVPESTKGGMPLFYMPPNSTSPVLAQQPHNPKDSGLDQFAAFWKRIALMEPKRWQRWLHTHRIGMLLLPDLPLPKHLHLPNSSGRYASIQYRMALKEVNSLLKKKSTFILLDNHSYIKLNFTESGGPPISFYIIRVSSKTPLVLRLAFLGGTPGHERNKVVMELKKDLLALTMPKKKVSTYVYDKQHGTKTTVVHESDSDTPPGMGNDSCVVLLSRPIEMILMRYDKMPADFTDLKTSIEVTATSVPVYMNSKAPSSTLNRLACYLHHRRWIWEAQGDHSVQMSTKAVANILDVLTKLRLQQGFHVAYSTSGILSFVMELKMKNPLASIMEKTKPRSEKTEAEMAGSRDAAPKDTSSTNGHDVFPCLLQYIIFPPHSATFKRDRTISGGDEEDGDGQDTSEADGRLQLVTECWIEPQSGTIFDPPKQCPFFDGVTYPALPSVIFPMDQKIISVLLNFEHLRVMCSSDYDREMASTSSFQGSPGQGFSLSETIQRMPYSTDYLGLLPMCQQAHVVCSTFIPGKSENANVRSGHPFQHPKPNDILFTLLLGSLKAMTSVRLDLSARDSLLLAQSILDRHKGDDASLPFTLTVADISALLRDLNEDGMEDTVKAPEHGLSSLVVDAPRNIPKWTMFVTDVGKDHLILAFVPSSYKDLQLLMEKPEEQVEDKVEEGTDDVDQEEMMKKEDPNVESSDGTGVEASQSEIGASDGRSPCEEGSAKQSLALPIFIYDCSLSNLTNHLLGRLDQRSVKNVFKDLTFATQEAEAQAPPTPRAVPRHRSRAASEQNDLFTVPSQNVGKALEWFCGHLSDKVHKTFVIGLFKSLQLGQWVDCRDVQFAIDWVCVDSQHEIDIAEFVQVVCGHVYRVRAKVDAEKQAEEKLQKKIKFADQMEGDGAQKPLDRSLKSPRSEFKSSIAGRKSSGIVIPLEDLTAMPGCQCEITKGLHAMARERFTQVMGAHFKQVPSNPDIWYYHMQRDGEEEEMEEEEDVARGDRADENNAEDDEDHVFLERDYHESSEAHMDYLRSSLGPSASHTPEVFSSENVSSPSMLNLAKPANGRTSARHRMNSYTDGTVDEENEEDYEQDDDFHLKEYDSKINSIPDVYQKSNDHSIDFLSDPSHGRSSVESVMGSYEEEISPLFVTLVCSVKLQTNMGHLTVRTIPTCLGELITCLESQPSKDFDLNNLSMTLDIICLTLPPDLDFPQDIGELDDEDMYRGASFTEHSPPLSPAPDAPDQLRANTLSTSDVGELANDMMDSLGSLPDAQRDAIHATEVEVKWLLQDEIVSAMLYTKQVTMATLEMVADHVEHSVGKANCIAEELALQFVFGSEQSLAKFTSEFERLSIPKYQFSKVQDYYYLSLDQLHAETLRKSEAIKTALESCLQLREQGQEAQRQTDHHEGSAKDGQGLVVPTTTIIYTPPSPEKHPAKRTKDEKRDAPSDPSLTQGAGSVMKMQESKDRHPSDLDSLEKEDGDVASHRHGNSGEEEEEDGKPGEEMDDVEDEATLDEGVTLVAMETEPLPADDGANGEEIGEGKAEDREEKEIGEGNVDKTEGEFPTEGAEGDDMVRHAEDNISRSSGSSIMVLSEEPTLEDPSCMDQPDANLEVAMGNQPGDDDEDGSDKEEVFSGEGSEGTSTLRRSSISFEVLTRASDEAVLSDGELASTTLSHVPDDTPSPTSQVTSPSPLGSSTSSSPVRVQVGSGGQEGTKRPTHSRQGSGGISSGPSSLFQSYVSQSGSTGDNDEEGYEASSSDVDPEELATSMDVFHGTMPDFWLILKLCRDKVNLFFHTRERNESKKLLDQKETYQFVSEAISNKCRLVNQRLLLQELDNRKVCNRLLVPESDEDIWKQEDHTLPIERRLSDDLDADESEQEAKDYLAATLDFNPGHFACDRVFTTSLQVHSRLKPSHRHGAASRGLQAMKTALTAFAVQDRKNLFVYRESSGEVFYLRLYESTVASNHPASSRLCSIAESSHSASQPNSQPASQSVSRATSIQSLNTIPGSIYLEDDSVSSHMVSDANRHPRNTGSRSDSGFDTQSISSVTTKASSLQGGHHIIRVDVFGVTTAGPEITNDLVDLLRKKLESATLDVIADMLARNPLCKLTPDDVQFIQPWNKPPTESYQFTIPQWAMQYLNSVRYYLRQNLLQNQFLHPPKYIDGKPENHFQDCHSWQLPTGHGVPMEPSEADVFLYNRPHQAEGGTGTACVATSLVDGCGNPVVLMDCPLPSVISHKDPFGQMDFQTLVNTSVYAPNQTPSKKPGPVALIQFFIWCRGSVDLALQLQHAVEHALCDTLTEYYVLTAPMAHIPGEDARPKREHVSSPPPSPTIVHVEPGKYALADPRKRPTSSPVGMKRSMSVGESPQFFSTDIKLLLKRIQKRSQSVTPGLIASGGSTSSGESTPSGPVGRTRRLIGGISPQLSPSTSRPLTPTKSRIARELSFKEHGQEGRTSWQIQEMDRRLEEEMRERRQEAEEGKAGTLHPTYSGLALRWFQFLADLDTPSVSLLTGTLSRQFSLEVFLQEFLDKLGKISTDFVHKLYQADGETFKSFTLPPTKRQESETSKSSLHLPGSEQTFVLIGRNVQQWRYSVNANPLDDVVQPPNLTNPKSQKSLQQFDPLDLSCGVSEKGLLPSWLTGLKQHPQSLRLIVPRQRLLLLQASNKQVKVFVYNWSNDKLSALDKLFQRLVKWHNARAHFLDCLVSQKMGLYQHCRFGAHQSDNPFSRSLEAIDSLVKQTSLPSREFGSRPQGSSSRPSHLRRLHPALPPFDETLQNVRPRHPLQSSPYRLLNDPVLRNGAQFATVCRNTRKELEVQKDLENLYVAWQKRGQLSRQPISVISTHTLEFLKQRSRVVHYCATPLLFDPRWRDHVLASSDGTKCVSSRPAGLTSEAPWHNDLKNSMVSQYKHFLQRLGFNTVETQPQGRPRSSHIRPGGPEVPKFGRLMLRTSQPGAEGHLQITVPGGIILIELSFRHTYFCVKLYAFESSRVPAGKTINAQLANLFTNDCDKYKDLIHLHSFAYDFHLRTIQAYLADPDMGFQSHYHVSSFLASFVKFYAHPPNFRQNCIKKDTIPFLSLNTQASLLYDYLVRHCPPGWKKLTMRCSSPPSSSNSTPEVGLPGNQDGPVDQALCLMHSSIHPRFHNMLVVGDDLDLSVVVAWDQAEYRFQTRPNSPAVGGAEMSVPATPEGAAMHHKNMLQLEFYIIVTSRRDLFPLKTNSQKVAVSLSQKPVTLQRFELAETEAANFRDRIVAMLTNAEMNCRRDTLWDQLLMFEAEEMEHVAMAASTTSSKKASKRDSAEEDDFETSMSYPEFKVLLGCVHHTPLSKLDPTLGDLLHNSNAWYADLFRALRARRYPIITRFVESEDRKIKHLVLLLANTCNEVVLLTVDETTEMAELELLSKSSYLSDVPDIDHDSQARETQKHIENIINAIGYHLWTTVF
ncbi:KICSTOR complex protein SZT2-like [Diadema antillarum]|uniref:KICSTOR complex protein SZT2-like n=1 Tax=Diadema antillarum TaxID=105358 RepID=UPI003A870A53